ncbi:MAG: hypothetical protein V7K64_19445 [Nostoc sp.]|uniref:hypothetical protein n=1 Tax=Nostoc sp. TaxID=1180 RepID=UPI002FF5672D
MKKPNPTAIIFRFWQWGAMHSPNFNDFMIGYGRTRFNLEIRLSKWTRKCFSIRLSLLLPTRLVTHAPLGTVHDFIDYMKTQEIEIDPSIIDGIDF